MIDEVIAIHPFDLFVLLRDTDVTDIYDMGEVDEVVHCPRCPGGLHSACVCPGGPYISKNKLYRIKAAIYRVTCRAVVLTDEFEIPRGDGFARCKTNPTP